MIPLPEAFIGEIKGMPGVDAAAFFRALEEKPALALRVNPLKEGAFALAEEFAEERVPWEENGYYLKEGTRPGLSSAHCAGAFYLQEASAMLAVCALAPVPGEKILDLCAAPGGKSTQIAGRLAGKGLLVSNEPEPSRAKILSANLERFGARNAVVTNSYPAPLAERWGECFDAVLCDAPCSGEGMFRRDPETRAQWNPASPEGCAKRQAEILDSAAALVKPGGRLVYSTCTFNRRENEETIAAFLERHPEFSPEDFIAPGIGASRNGMLRVWPHLQRGDGHFTARMRKKGILEEDIILPPRTDRETAALLRTLREEICNFDAGETCFERVGDYLYAVPLARPDVRGIKLVSRGLCLLRIGRGYIEPQHQLAAALRPGEVRRRADLDDFQAARFLAGETVESPGEKGFTLVCYKGLPLGWGKRTDGILKNHLPKALRSTSGHR